MQILSQLANNMLINDYRTIYRLIIATKTNDKKLHACWCSRAKRTVNNPGTNLGNDMRVYFLTSLESTHKSVFTVVYRESRKVMAELGSRPTRTINRRLAD